MTETPTLELAPQTDGEKPLKHIAPFDSYKEQVEKLKTTAELKAQKEREAIEAQAKKDSDRLAEIAEKQRQETAKLAAELAEKKAAEAKAEADRLAAEKKAAAAPDKAKLSTLAAHIRDIAIPNIANATLRTTIATQREKFAAWIEAQAETL